MLRIVATSRSYHVISYHMRLMTERKEECANLTVIFGSFYCCRRCYFCCHLLLPASLSQVLAEAILGGSALVCLGDIRHQRAADALRRR